MNLLHGLSQLLLHERSASAFANVHGLFAVESSDLLLEIGLALGLSPAFVQYLSCSLLLLGDYLNGHRMLCGGPGIDVHVQLPVRGPPLGLLLT